MCDNRAVTSPGVKGLVVLGVGAVLTGCATQHQTAQALTIVGAAAVVVGASMAADQQCYAGGPEGAAGYCGPGWSKGARNAGTGVAVAGVGLAAAGYALMPKGPDVSLPPAPVGPVSAAPYRLVRPGVPEAPLPATLPVAPEPAPAVEPECRPGGSASAETASKDACHD
jgi:hypothetical protein